MTQSHGENKKPRVEVLCLTYGEPPENEWRPQFEYSLSILNRLTRRVAPIPKFVTPLLAARRGLIRKKMFEEMGYHSPLEELTPRQAEKIHKYLEEKRPDVDFRVRMVCEFRPPLLPEILEKMNEDPPDELILLPLYIAESDFTFGISRTDLDKFHKNRNGQHRLPAPAYVGGFCWDERFGRELARFVEHYCEQHGWDEEKCRDAALVLGAHGTLQYPPEGINSGAKETLHLFGLVRKHLKDRFRTVRIGWLNHTLGGKWTFPSADETAQELQDQGTKKVVYFPFGFMGDNNESQNEGKLALNEFEWEDLLYLPCPNDDESFCELLAQMTLERLERPEREDWDAITEGGRQDLIQRPRPAVKGRPGFLRFNGPTLAVVGILFWFLAGSILLVRGFITATEIESPMALGVAVFLAVLIGWYKGFRIIGKVALRNLRRLRRVPQPSPLYKMFSKASWLMILFFMALGMSLRLVGMPPAAYAAILIGVGLSLFLGGVVGLKNYREAIPLYILTMETRPSDLEKLRTRPNQ